MLQKKYEYKINQKESRVVEVEIMLQEQRETNRMLKEDNSKVLEELRILRLRSDEQICVNEELLYQSDKTYNELEDLRSKQVEDLRSKQVEDLRSKQVNDIKDSFKKININEINNTSLVDPRYKEALILISVSFSNNDLIYLINRCQIDSYKYIRV